MTRDPSVIVLGLGVDDFKGLYGTTRGLQDEFGPERVFDTPLSEDGMTGVAIGAAMAGLRPIHVHIRMDFVLLAMNQIVNMAAKARYMYGGAVSVPIVVRSIIGRSWGQGPQHSQALHALFMHIPGLRVVAPSTPRGRHRSAGSAWGSPQSHALPLRTWRTSSTLTRKRWPARPSRWYTITRGPGRRCTRKRPRSSSSRGRSDEQTVPPRRADDYQGIPRRSDRVGTEQSMADPGTSGAGVRTALGGMAWCAARHFR